MRRVLVVCAACCVALSLVGCSRSHTVLRVDERSSSPGDDRLIEVQQRKNELWLTVQAGRSRYSMVLAKDITLGHLQILYYSPATYCVANDGWVLGGVDAGSGIVLGGIGSYDKLKLRTVEESKKAKWIIVCERSINAQGTLPAGYPERTPD